MHSLEGIPDFLDRVKSKAVINGGLDVSSQTPIFPFLGCNRISAEFIDCLYGERLTEVRKKKDHLVDYLHAGRVKLSQSLDEAL